MVYCTFNKCLGHRVHLYWYLMLNIRDRTFVVIMKRNLWNQSSIYHVDSSTPDIQCSFSYFYTDSIPVFVQCNAPSRLSNNDI